MYKALIDAILSRGHFISFFDGMEYPVKISRDRDELLSWENEVDVAELIVRDSIDREKIGWFLLIFSNGDDLIADCIDNEFCREICSEVEIA